MSDNKGKVYVGLSGGVDSSVAAGLLIEDGYECVGMYMVTCEEGAAKLVEAEAVADRLGIELEVVDLQLEFEQILLDYFGAQYKRGRTPNPCVYCNRHIKFGKLWEYARGKGADHIATGHYAKIIIDGEKVGLYSAGNLAKDQSYALSMVERDVLGYVKLPLCDHSKNQTRAAAARLGVGTEGKSESQEICFIPDDDYVGVLEGRWPELVRAGKIVDSSGKVLGEHMGTHRYTIGQRRGLRVAMGVPYYVVGLDAENNTVTLGPKSEVMSRSLRTSGVNWLIDEPLEEFRGKVKIRYNSAGVWGLVRPVENGFEVRFEEDVSAITPGQIAAVYIENENGSKVVCGGWIEKAGI